MRKSAHSRLISCGVRFEALALLCSHNKLSANIACEFSHNQLRSFFFYFLLLLSAMNYSGVSQQSPGAVYQQTEFINFLKVERLDPSLYAEIPLLIFSFK
jgi:hypothetical protein